jgi:hypothetical protein
MMTIDPSGIDWGKKITIENLVILYFTGLPNNISTLPVK